MVILARTDTPFVTILPYPYPVLQTVFGRAAGTISGALSDLLIHLLLSVEMSRIVSPDDLDIHMIILISQPPGLAY
jgi:hypothetical protein